MRQEGEALARLGLRVVDLDTGKTVPAVRWVDVEAGLVEAYFTDGRGRVKTDANGDRDFYVGAGHFKVAPLSRTRPPRTTPARRGPALGAPRCARCPSVLTLPGSDLCAPCNAADRGYRHPMRAERLTTPFLSRKCEGCSRPAAWAVSDEVGVTPEADARPSVTAFGVTFANPLWERGATVGRRFYCDFCYRPPRVLDPKGEVVEEIEGAHGARPQ